MTKKDAPRRSEYPYIRKLTTRWMDNDIYGHVNNAHYYSYFDSVLNEYLIKQGGLDIRGGAVVGFIVSSQCDYFRPLSYPDAVEIGLRVDRIGHSSVRYGLAVLLVGDAGARVAGSRTHAYVDLRTAKSTSIPFALRQALEAIAVRQP